MEQFRFMLQTEYLENSVQNYLIFIVAIILGLLFKGLISKYLSHSLYKIIGAKEKRDSILENVDNEKIVEIQQKASLMFEKLRKGEKIETLKD